MWQELADILNEIYGSYERLFKIGQEKQNALVAVDLKKLDLLLKEQERTVAEVQRAEKSRQVILKKLSEQLPNIHSEMKMTELYAHSPQAYRARLEKLHEQLNTVTAKVDELEQNNKILITSALQTVNYRLNQLGGTAVEPSYGTQGEELVSRQKKFDFHA